MTEKTIDLDQRVMAQKANDLRVAIGYVRFTSKESHVMAAALGIWAPSARQSWPLRLMRRRSAPEGG
jgi:hypothetical protein